MPETAAYTEERVICLTLAQFPVPHWADVLLLGLG